MLVAVFMLVPAVGFAGQIPEKDHDFLPKVHNVIFLIDVSDSMLAGYPKNFDHSRLFVATRAFALFNNMMPHVPHWQYDMNTALITFGDCSTPKILSPLGPWTRAKYAPYYNCLRQEGFGPYRTATLQDALQLAGQLVGTVVGRTAIVIFSDGGTQGECPQKTVTALKDLYGDKVEVFAIFFGDREVGWRNLYEVCLLSGGYARRWEEVRSKPQMKDFAWDITVREIMFPYPEIFFAARSPDLLPSEAVKLEAVANFLRAIPQYQLQIDGHTSFLGSAEQNYKLGLARAENVKKALVIMYKIHPERILVHSFGEELPRYDNQHPDLRYKNNQTNLYLKLPLRNYPYDEKRLHTFGISAVGDLYNTQERDSDTEWAWPDKPVSETILPIGSDR
jgi:hypothetical protein